MKICPNCLITVSKEKHFCHQCGSGIDKSLANKSQKISSKRKLSKSELMHKFKFLKLNKNKRRGGPQILDNGVSSESFYKRR